MAAFSPENTAVPEFHLVKLQYPVRLKHAETILLATGW
jgi:hypothetical protein